MPMMRRRIAAGELVGARIIGIVIFGPVRDPVGDVSGA